MRKMKTYDLHPCMQCGEAGMTTNKNYCDKHLALAMRPAVPTRSDPYSMFANVEGKMGGRRRESVNTIR